MTEGTITIQARIDKAKEKENYWKEKYIECLIERFKERGYEVIETENRPDKLVISYKIPRLVSGYVLRMVVNWSEIL